MGLRDILHLYKSVVEMGLNEIRLGIQMIRDIKREDGLAEDEAESPDEGAG